MTTEHELRARIRADLALVQSTLDCSGERLAALLRVAPSTLRRSMARATPCAGAR